MRALWRPTGGIAGVALGPRPAARRRRIVGLDPGRPSRTIRLLGGRAFDASLAFDHIRDFHRSSSTLSTHWLFGGITAAITAGKTAHYHRDNSANIRAIIAF